MDDLSGKSEKLNPLFQATSDLSESVSDLNNASRNFVKKANETSKSMSTTTKAIRAGFTVMKLVSKFRRK